jgi:membrane protein DedA with SNARE-associated domain
VVLASLSDSITSAVSNHGVPAVFGLMAVDAIFPAASELVMLYAGAVAAGAFGSNGVNLFGHHFGPGVSAYVVMALAGTLGYLVGGLIGWAIGRYGGRPLLERHGRWFHLSPKNLDKAEKWFDRWGNVGVALGRITPLVRSFVSIPAGVFEMPLGPYTFLTLVGSAVWAFAFAGAGYGLGTSYGNADHAFRFVEYAVAAGIMLLAAYVVYRWRAKAKVQSNADDSAR